MKRAQQAMETIMIVVILAILLFLGIYFYAKLSGFSDLDREERFRQEQLFSVALQLSHMPELNCPSEGGQTRTCMDKIKLELFSEAMTKPTSDLYDDKHFLRYRDLFGQVHIEVTKIYPTLEDPIIVLSTNTTGEAIAQNFPIILYNAEEDTNELGLLWVYKQ